MNTPRHGKYSLSSSSQWLSSSSQWLSHSPWSSGDTKIVNSGAISARSFRDQLVASSREDPDRRFSALVAFRARVESEIEAMELIAAHAPFRSRRDVELQHVFGHLTRSAEIQKWIFHGARPSNYGGVAVDAPSAALLRLWDSGIVASVEQEVVYRTCLDRVGGIVGSGEAFDSGLTGSGVTVAIIDTGIDLAHSAFEVNRISPHSRNFIKGDDPLDYADRDGHGTHVAGIVGGGGSLEGRFRGIVPGAQLMILKVSESRRIGSTAVARAIDHAIEMGADVISISIGYGPWDPPNMQVPPPWVWSATDSFEELMVNSALSHGRAAIVTAAGNDGRLTPCESSIRRPGICQGALTVGSVDLNPTSPNLSGFSSIGPVLRTSALDAGAVLSMRDLPGADVISFHKPDVLAPGGHITDQAASGFACSDSQGIVSAKANLGHLGSQPDGYIASAGTSMSCPVVAGLAALIIEFARDKRLDLDKIPERGLIVHNIIRATSRSLGLPRDRQGYGLVSWPRIRQTLANIADERDYFENYIRRPAYFE